jgi:hypothetical protein
VIVSFDEKFVIFFFFAVVEFEFRTSVFGIKPILGIKPKVSHVLGKHSTPELYLQPQNLTLARQMLYHLSHVPSLKIYNFSMFLYICFVVAPCAFVVIAKKS